MRKLMMALAVAGTAVPAIEAPAQARPHYGYYNGGRTYYAQPRYYGCRRGNGTTGLIVGGALGALLGRSLDGGRNHTLGTVAGAAGGALLGREVQRSRQTRNCFR
ncbi:glycine zipper 2TM domain-containing protein [Sphingomonas tabacisoli]|uniref:17 kDa surface antigen n=1 Tax=Sphingomonas tabacisoli TaxID=2249466 RepID=A0ABW4I3H2_9SPHN